MLCWHSPFAFNRSTEEPVSGEPVSEKPVSLKPVSEKPVLCWHSPFAFNTSTEEPATEKPVTENVYLKNLFLRSLTAAFIPKVSNNSARMRSIWLYWISKDWVEKNPWNCPRDWLISSHGCRDTLDYLFHNPGYGYAGYFETLPADASGTSGPSKKSNFPTVGSWILDDYVAVQSPLAWILDFNFCTVVAPLP